MLLSAQAGALGAAQAPKVAAALLRLLHDVAVSYRLLVSCLQAAHGDAGVRLELPPGALAARAAEAAAAGATAVAAAATAADGAPQVCGVMCCV
jgi:hypothetical protein